MGDEIGLIRDLIKEQDEKRAEQIKGVLLQVNAGFDAANESMLLVNLEIKSIRIEMEGYKEAKTIQNGRIDNLENRTVIKISRFGEEKTKVFFFYLLVAYLGLAELFQYISISDVVKKYLPN